MKKKINKIAHRYKENVRPKVVFHISRFTETIASHPKIRC